MSYSLGIEQVYFIKAEEVYPIRIKIGRSLDPESRFQDIANISPVLIKFLGSMVGGHEEERKVHDKFKENRLHGEWFLLTDDLEDFIENAIKHPFDFTVECNKATNSHTKATTIHKKGRFTTSSDIMRQNESG